MIPILFPPGSSPASPPRRQHYWTVHVCPGAKRKTTGAFEGGRSYAIQRGRPGDVNQPKHRASAKRDRTRHTSFESEVSIPRRAKSRGYREHIPSHKKERAEAVLLLGTGPLASQRTRVIDLAVKNQLPAVYPSLDFVQAGGLMGYGTNNTDLDRRAATYVDKILKGSKARRSYRWSNRPSSNSSSI